MVNLLCREVHEEVNQAREKATELKQRRQEQATNRREKLKQAYLRKQLEKLKAQQQQQEDEQKTWFLDFFSLRQAIGFWVVAWTQRRQWQSCPPNPNEFDMAATRTDKPSSKIPSTLEGMKLYVYALNRDLCTVDCYVNQQILHQVTNI